MKTKEPSPSTTIVCDMSMRNYAGNIQSPSYPGNYDDLTKCTYRILAVGDDYCSVYLKILDFDIESTMDNSYRPSSEPICLKDWLELDSKRLCGHRPERDECKFTSLFLFRMNNQIFF